MEPTPPSPLGGPCAHMSPFELSVFRVTVYQVWLPPKAGPQDGAPGLLQCPGKAQSHPPHLQPPGVLPACVSVGEGGGHSKEARYPSAAGREGQDQSSEPGPEH